MTTHNSAYKLIIPFGKYKGYSLGYIHNVNKGYLDWLVITQSMPEFWRIAASKVLSNQDISDLLPNSTIPSSPPPRVRVEKINADTLRVNFDYNQEFLERFKFEIDGRKWNGEDKCWEIPAVQITKLVNMFGGTQHIDADDATKAIWKEEMDRRADLDSIRVKDDSEHISKSLESVLKLPLFNYQNVAVEFAERAGGRAMVADQMGLGKTVVAIGFAAKNNYKTLVVCPKSVVVNWMREIKRFTGKGAVCWAGEGRLGPSKPQYHVINYDVVEKNLVELNKMGFDLLVCDEATYLKNRQTKRSKSVLGYYKERKKYPGIKSKNCLFLTGTPVLNRPVEAFHLLNYLDKNRFNNFYHFITRYGGWRGSEPQNLDELHDRTKDLIIRRVKKDVLTELPDKQRNDLYVEMTLSDMKEYDTHLATLFRKWRQLGKPTVAEMPAIQKFLLTKKIPRAIEMIDELLEAGKGVLVFSVYLDPLKHLKKYYGDKSALIMGEMNNTQRQETIDKLSTGEAKIGLFSIGAGSMGIDGIQNQIDTVIFLDMWWVPSVHEQAEDRVHRIGQNNKVQVFYLMCENTMDEYMRGILVEKQKIIDTVVDGKLLSIARDKSFFKEFVALVSKNYSKDVGKYTDVEDISEN